MSFSKTTNHSFFQKETENKEEQNFNVNKAEILKKIKPLQLKRLESYIDDFATMANLISEETVNKHLAQLNFIFEEKLNTLGLLEFIDGNKSIKKKEGKSYTSNYKILSNFFEEWAKQNGFNQGGFTFGIIKDKRNFPLRRILINLPSAIPTLVGSYISPNLFQAILLKNGYIFKDLGVDTEHGEFTHIIGLYIIVEENKERNVLKHPIIELYKKLPGAAWKVIFDNNNNTPNSPEFLHELIKTSPHRIISSIIVGREMKRSFLEEKMQTTTRIINLEKVQKNPGILIDEGIFFEKPYTGEHISLTYDGVYGLCNYNLALSASFPKIYIDPNLSLLDKLIKLFTPKNNLNKDINRIYNQFILDKSLNYCISHQSIVKTLISLQKNNKCDYVAFLINEAKHLLIQHDEIIPSELEDKNVIALTKN